MNRGGSRTSPIRGRQSLGGRLPNILIVFSENPYEIKEILGRRGARAGVPPPKSATDDKHFCQIWQINNRNCVVVHSWTRAWWGKIWILNCLPYFCESLFSYQYIRLAVPQLWKHIKKSTLISAGRQRLLDYQNVWMYFI